MDARKNYLTVETTVQAPIEKVWEYWTTPAHITNVEMRLSRKPYLNTNMLKALFDFH